MVILVNNKAVAMKADTSFDFVAENRLFSGSDGYTLSMTFPLRGCPENIAVFGNIHRPDVAAGKAVFDCEIRDADFHRFGTLAITEISENELQAQFLEGRSEQNFSQTFDNTYIDELDLGRATSGGIVVDGGHDPEDDRFSFGAGESVRPGGSGSGTGSEMTPFKAWTQGAVDLTCVALPWVNDSNGVPQNFAEWDGQSYSWTDGVSALSWQPYLIFIARKICGAVGYSCDFRPWEDDYGKSHLLICNTLPAILSQFEFSKVLPHWTVAEFFERLEFLLDGEFDIDHRGKSVTFGFSRDILSTIEDVCLPEIVDEHTVAVQVESPECDYLYAKNIKYADADYSLWKYYSCDWLMERVVTVPATNSVWPAGKIGATYYSTLRQLLDDNWRLRDWDGGFDRNTNRQRLMYAADMDMYFICRPVSKELVDDRGRYFNHYSCVLQPVNIFGARVLNDSEDADLQEIDFIPARVDFTEEKYGRCLFVNVGDGSTDSGADAELPSMSAEDRKSYFEGLFQLTQYQYVIERGEVEQGNYFDKIYVAYWDGALQMDGKLPFPFVENVVISQNWESYYLPRYSLRLNDRLENEKNKVTRIDPSQKFTFSFLAGSAVNASGAIRGIPNPRAMFFIRGKKYVCAQITATFTENGMSRMLKGEFYRVAE